MACSVQYFKQLVVGSVIILVVVLHSAIQINLSFYGDGKNNPLSSSPPLEYSESRIRLKKRSLSQPDEESPPPSNLLTATLLKPVMTSTPFPTLTTERSYKSVLPPQTSSITIPSAFSSTLKESGKTSKHVTDWSDVPEHLFVKRYYTGNFSHVNEDLCERRKKNLTLLILVTSAIDNFQHRSNVRLTWGHYGQRDDVQFAFVVGDALLSQFNESMRHALAEEIDLYQDFIIGSFADTYRRLTLKTLHMLDWASTYCMKARYFLKTDDDMFLNIPKILDFIETIKDDDEQQPKIYGHVFSGHLPKRNESHKHHLKYDIYPRDIPYPDFTSGPAYLMSMGIVRPLFHEALKLPFIPLEDVLINGFAAMNLNIPRVDVPGFINEIKNPVELSACELYSSVMAGMTDGSAVQMSFVWYNYLMGRTICIWRRTKED
ncbi:lactosylceramide 1,3-N-acetyl-beta-D-glucosaminyltransferase isoform X2 [Folsomia candida]|uniref:lactosylceramide 1,3-N-acetyl-beta-D-glucosaminyltransferase isoform X2 n=1 Tax=Folsomia candida TaxID=158441 RepID=UPI001604AB16|nr:lactosylceramide 1,3-N-acetyl-beta-D-glucosaminyltransferase isoform X2 [Folsomia candida]